MATTNVCELPGDLLVKGSLRVGGPSPWSDVKAKGAVGDNVADDTSAFRAAIDQVSAGGTVFVPPGTYRVTSKLTVPNGVSIKGPNARTGVARVRTFQAGSDPLFEVKNGSSFDEWVTFDDIELYGNGTNHTGGGILVYGPYHVFVNRCAVYNFGGTGIKAILAGSSNQNVRISNCHVYYNVGGGIHLEDGFDSSIADCVINQNGFFGLYLKSQVNTLVTSCEFAAYFYGNTAAGASHQAVPVALNSDQRTTLLGCRWENNGGQSGTAGYNVRTGWDGVGQANTSNSTRSLNCINSIFSGALAANRDLNHVRLHGILGACFNGCHFEHGGFAGTYYGVEFGTNILKSNVNFIGGNEWGSGLTGKFTGTAPAYVLLDDSNLTYGTAAPASETWAVGNLRFNTAPTAGGKIGWVCTTAGSPGTWKPWGPIDA